MNTRTDTSVASLETNPAAHGRPIDRHRWTLISIFRRQFAVPHRVLTPQYRLLIRTTAPSFFSQLFPCYRCGIRVTRVKVAGGGHRSTLCLRFGSRESPVGDPAAQKLRDGGEQGQSFCPLIDGRRRFAAAAVPRKKSNANAHGSAASGPAPKPFNRSPLQLLVIFVSSRAATIDAPFSGRNVPHTK